MTGRGSRPSSGTRRHSIGGTLLLALLLMGAGCGDTRDTIFAPDPEGPCTSGNALCGERVEVAPGVYIPVFTTYPLAEGSREADLAVIVVHGANRDADNYFSSMVLAAGSARALSTTVIVSPHFQTEVDAPKADEARWTSGGWKKGHLSLSSGPAPRVSSYQALDRILEMVTDPRRFPSVTRVVVTGHSAGGQVVHRYAATSPVDEESVGVPIRYAPANPSTWLYLGPERWDGSGFSLPTARACPEYDDWHYGLEERNTYARTVSADSIRSLLTRRDVRVLAGDADNGSASLDESCGANLQGAFRYERALRLVAFMDALFPGHRHRLTVVPGVGHSSLQMFTSEPGLAAIFLP